MKNLAIALICLFSVFTINLNSQQICGTLVSDEQIQLETTFVDSVNELILLEKTIYISAHIVKNKEGVNGIDVGAINGAIYNLNELFETIGLRFQLLKTNIIDNYNYNTVYYGNQDKEITILSSIDNTINLYFVEFLYDHVGSPIHAYTYMPADSKDILFFKKSDFNSTILAEQIGHFFNLYHTHETAFGNEFADQSNCETTGDLCCDTYADPNLQGFVSDKCDYTGNQKDEQNKYYSPGVHNFMSFTEQTCKCFYSEEQYIRMLNAVLKLKKHLWE